MKFIPKTEFLHLILSNNIGKNLEYPHSSNLVFLQKPFINRFWQFPENPINHISFFLSFIDIIFEKSGGWLYPSEGIWIDSSAIETQHGKTMSSLIKPLNITYKDRGAIYFEEHDINELSEILNELITESWTHPDPYLIPITGKYLISFDHHDTVSVTFQNESDIEPIIIALAKKDIYLPTNYPDSTFKPVDWVKKTK